MPLIIISLLSFILIVLIAETISLIAFFILEKFHYFYTIIKKNKMKKYLTFILLAFLLTSCSTSQTTNKPYTNYNSKLIQEKEPH